MSRIINPLAPPRNYMNELLNTMRLIAAYREQFFKLEALKQCDGVSPAPTASELLLIEEEQQRAMQDMVTFILYGDKNGKHDNTSASTPFANIENHTQKPTKETP